MVLKSGYNGSLWVTYHKARKIEGSQSIMAMCTKKCNYAKFCYALKMQKVYPNITKKALENTSALESDNFISPILTADIIRWFSLGSCNGSVQALQNIKQAVKDNPHVTHGIWIEPFYWTVAKKIFKGSAVKMVYSNKTINTIKRLQGYVTFNLASDKTNLDKLLKENPDAKHCIGNCQSCGWYCYKADEGIVVEKVRY